jgi:hypothetical protein
VFICLTLEEILFHVIKKVKDLMEVGMIGKKDAEIFL